MFSHVFSFFRGFGYSIVVQGKRRKGSWENTKEMESNDENVTNKNIPIEGNCI